MNEQIDLFSYVMPKFKIDRPIRLIELFAGIGSQAKALKNLGVEFEHHFVCEIDVHAIRSYNAIHNTNFETKDITKVSASELNITERERYCYILTYSFPCQDISMAGLQKGYAKGTSTRSGLLWEVERLLDECNGNLPQVLLMENVPQVIGKKNIKDFHEWYRKLESLGYTNYVQLLNSKQVGYPEPIPQNRNRCFMVSILGKYHYTFPKKSKLKKKLKDMLEDKVDEKYYLSDKMINGMLHSNFNYYKLEAKDVTDRNEAKTIISRFEGTPQCIVEKENEGGVAIKNNNSKGYAIAQSGDGIDISSRMQHHRGTVQKGMSQTLDTQCNVGVIDEEISS